MLTITTISILFAFYSQLSHAITGPNGQECSITNSNLCPMNGATFSSLSDSEIECEDPYECCLCESITCGTTYGEKCEKFVAEDTNSAFSVYPITIIGDTDDGAEIECSGDNACNGAKIKGTFIKELKCSKNRACANSEIDLIYIDDEGKVECGGDFACYNSLFTVTNAETLCCDGEFSCSHSVINIINPKKDFEIQCKETASCQDTTIIIHLTSSSRVTELNGIKCESDASCMNVNIHIINESPFSVEFEDLDCTGKYACQNTVFTVVETTNAIIFDDCECSDTGCVNTVQGGIGTPIANGQCFGFASIITPVPTTSTTYIPTAPTTPAPTTTPVPTTSTTYPPGFVLGPNGQDCTPGNDDNLPDACPIINNVYTSLIGTEIECEENHDCCTCKSITCGYLNGEPCEKFNANGDSSAFYVYPIVIHGDFDDGTEIDCNGDRSCEGARFSGTNIKDIKCSGDISCSNTQWNIECIYDDDGCKIECDGDMSCQNSIFKVSHSNGLTCADFACTNSQFYLNNNLGEKIECDAEYACQNAFISVAGNGNIGTLKCGDEYACNNATIIINNPGDEFEIECEGPYACENSNITIIIPIGSTIEEMESIKCGEQFACRNAYITIINERIGMPLVIEELNCEAFGSCFGTEFNLIGDIMFEECKCGDNSGCLDIIGIDSCFIALDKLECKNQACAGQNITIINPEKDFELKCEDIASCHELSLTIIINNNAKDYPIDELKGVKCDKSISCLGLKYTVINQQIGVDLEVEKIECEGANSCVNSRFSGNGGGNVVFKEIKCEEDNACGIVGSGNECLAEYYSQLVYCGSPIFDN